MLAGRDGARGRIRTCTGDALDVVSLLVGLGERESVEGGKAIPRGSWSLNNHLSTINQEWSLPPVLPRHDFFTKEIHRLLQGGVNGLPSRSSESEGWSQSPVLPWAQRAYDARLSAGSTAVIQIVNRKSSIANERNPHPEWSSQVLQVRCPTIDVRFA